MHYPQDTETFGLEKQWMLGEDLLVTPVIEQGETSTNVYFPGKDNWFDVISYEKYEGGSHVRVAASLTKIPVYQRSGSIVFRKMRARRSTQMMISDPYTVIVALDAAGESVGSLYIDDESSFEYKTSKAYCDIKFSFSRSTLTGEPNCSGGFKPGNVIERVILVGESAEVKSVTKDDASSLEFSQSEKHIIVKMPVKSVSEGFSLTFNS